MWADFEEQEHFELMKWMNWKKTQIQLSLVLLEMNLNRSVCMDSMKKMVKRKKRKEVKFDFVLSQFHFL